MQLRKIVRHTHKPLARCYLPALPPRLPRSADWQSAVSPVVNPMPLGFRVGFSLATEFFDHEGADSIEQLFEFASITQSPL